MRAIIEALAGASGALKAALLSLGEDANRSTEAVIARQDIAELDAAIAALRERADG